MPETWIRNWRTAVNHRDTVLMQALLANPCPEKLAAALVFAGEQDCLEGMRLLLNAGVDPNKCSLSGRSAITLLARAGREKAVQLLLDHGIRADELSQADWSPLHAAAEEGDAEMLRLLLQAGIKDESGPSSSETALQVAARRGFVEAARVLLDSGSQINAEKTPLSLASGAGHLEMARFLLERGADPNSADYQTPLAAAAGGGHVRIIELLLANGALLTKRNVNCRTPLHYAIEKDRPAAVQLLLRKGAETEVWDHLDRTPLMHAAGYAHHDRRHQSAREICTHLLSAGADVNAVNPEGRSPLLFAAAAGDAVRVGLLLEAGAQVDAASRWGWTPLMIATEAGRRDVIRRLLKGGATPLTWEKRRQIALLKALAAKEWRVSQLLLMFSREVNCTDDEGRTPLHLALEGRPPSPGVVRKLLATGANVNYPDQYGYPPVSRIKGEGFGYFMRLLLEAGADLSLGRVPVGTTQLIEQLRAGKVENTELMIAAGADLNAPDRQGITPLVYALYTSFRDPNRRILRALLKGGADAHAPGNGGKTALQIAAEHDDPELLQILQDHLAGKSEALPLADLKSPSPSPSPSKGRRGRGQRRGR